MHVLVEASYMNSHWCAHYLRGITAQEVLETACENACRLFGITLPSAAK